MVVRPALRFYMAGGRAGATQIGSVSGELSPAEVERLRQGDIDDVQEIKSKLMPKEKIGSQRICWTQLTLMMRRLR